MTAPRDDSDARGIVVYVIGLAILAISIGSHEMWRDEVQAWAIARSADNPLELLDNLAWERHPPLWHMLLWFVSRVVTDVFALKFVVFAIGGTTMWLLIGHAPFRLVTRVALMLGYFVTYEFGTISRSWSLVGLLTVAALVERGRNPYRPRVFLALLMAICATELHAVPIAFGLGAARLADDDLLPAVRRRAAALTAVGFTATTVALWLLVPAPDGNDSRRIRLPWESDFFDRVDDLRRAVVSSIFPIPEFETRFWNRALLVDSPMLLWVLPTVVLAIVTVLASRRRDVLVFWTIAVVGTIITVGTFGLPIRASRHASIVAIAVLAVFWQTAHQRPIPWRSFAGALAGASLFAGLAGSTWAIRTEVEAAFSAGPAAADFIDAQAAGQDVVILCPHRPWVCSAASIPLGVPLYETADDGPTHFLVWERGFRTDRSEVDTVTEARRLAASLDTLVAIVEPTAGNSDEVPCRNRFEPPAKLITRESMTVCMLDDVAEESG